MGPLKNSTNRFLKLPKIRRKIIQAERLREDLRCEFGCRAHHDREQSNERVRVYYQSEEGKKKKRAINSRRKKGPSNELPPQPPPVKKSRRERLLRYHRWILLVVDGRQVAWAELWILVTRIRQELRQRDLPDFENFNKVPDG